MLTIQLINKATVAFNFDGIVAALKAQAAQLHYSEWGTDVHVVTGTTTGARPITFLDDSDQAGALGYHDVENGVPLGRVFVKTDLQYGLDPGVTGSHEMIEMAIDLPAGFGYQISSTTWVADEACDPVEADADGYMIGNQRVSNFVLPSWYIPGSKGPWDYRSLLRGPLTLRPGGYAAVCRNGKWTSVFAQADGETSQRFRRQRRIYARAERIDQAASAGHGFAAMPVVPTEEREPGESIL